MEDPSRTLPVGMRIVGATWNSYSNVLIIQCPLGHRIVHHANRWRVKCPECGREENLGDIRKCYAGLAGTSKGGVP